MLPLPPQPPARRSPRFPLISSPAAVVVVVATTTIATSYWYVLIITETCSTRKTNDSVNNAKHLHTFTAFHCLWGVLLKNCPQFPSRSSSGLLFTCFSGFYPVLFSACDLQSFRDKISSLAWLLGLLGLLACTMLEPAPSILHKFVAFWN